MTIPVFQGKIWKFGDNISTDLLMPGFSHGKPPRERASFCMHANRPEFAAKVAPGDVIVAGRNFGCGSSRPAASNLMTLGISCVVAESFARLFFRNSINMGFPLLYCPGVQGAFAEGDTLQVDFRTGEVRNASTGKILPAEPLPQIAMDILDAGGVVALLKKEYSRSNDE
ncbi:MAG: 3-isopropylmalate dehydratase [Chloroflexi bacterium]|nr:3-isopropylmalate dehydratase [Chloroflexota bacterium]